MKDQKDRISIIQAFGKHLKKARKEKNLTQHDLENRSGLSLRTISDIERGVNEPRLGTLIKLTKGMNISLMELIEPLSKIIEKGTI